MAFQIEELHFEDLSTWLDFVSDSSPCGEDLEYDADYLALKRDIAPPEAIYDPSVRDQIEPEDDRNWQDLKVRADNLSKKTRSLGLVVLYAQILMNTEPNKVEGLTKGLYILHEYVTKSWSSIYPALDNDDDDPHYLRYSALSELGAWKSVVMPFKNDLIVLSIGLGDYTLDDIIKLESGADVSGKQPLSGLTTDELMALSKLKSDFQQCLDVAEKTATVLKELTGETFDGFEKYLIPCLKQGSSIFSSLDGHEENIASIDSQGGGSVGSSEAVASGSVGKSRGGGGLSIQSRDDVEKAFDLICEYYTKNEPSSPVPLFLQRAKKLVKQDFRSILDELRLGGSSDLEQIFGRQDS
jgi:type VI secretion system protein ImpA